MAPRMGAATVGLTAAVGLLVALAALIVFAGAPDESPQRTILTWVWTLRYKVSPLEGEVALASLHSHADDASREQCVACHGDQRESKLSVHRIHLRSVLLSQLACNECHPRVEIGARESTSARRLVDVGFCRKCHSAYPGLNPESHMHAEDIDADCTMCHTGARAIRHDQPYLSQIIPASECRGCHGGRVLPWTPRHEQEDWLELHGMEALDTGTEHCFECHNFGLKFCDECHAEKPPSHLPEERWRDAHPDAARADTRVCYACHETDLCKGCHLNHEEGWMQSHPEFVKERGQSSCTECHSESSCSYCHTSDVLDGGPDEAATPAGASD